MRNLLITGANSEISAAYIKGNGNKYDYIIAHYGKRRDRIDELIEMFGTKIIPICADLSSREDVEEFIMQMSGYDIHEYIHLAAPKLRHMRFEKGDMDEFDLEMQVVYWSFMRICQSVIPPMAKRKSGRVVAVITEYTVTDQPAYLSHYISAKYALLGLVKCLASEYATKGIRINGISPGMIETDFIAKLPRYVIDNNKATTVRGRNLVPEDLVSTLCFLLSEESDGINGQNILIQ